MEEDDQDKIKLQLVYQNITKTTPIFPEKFSNLILLFYNLFNIKKDDKIFYYTYSVKLERKLEDKNDELFFNQISKIKAQENPTIYVWDSNKDYDKLMNEESYLESKYYLDLNKSNETTSSVYLNNNYNEMKENLEKVENELKNTGDMINSEINNIIELQEEIEFFNDINNEKIHNNFHELKDKIKTLQNKNKTIEEKNTIDIKNLIEENNKLKKKLEENENLNNKIEELQNQLNKTNEENKELKNKIESNKKSYEEEINKIKEENTKIKEDRDCYINAFESKENEIKNINIILDEFKEKLKIKEEELSKKEKKENDMKKIIDNYKQKINELKETFNKKINELELDENNDNTI